MSVYKVTGLITEAFDGTGIHYRVCCPEDDTDRKEWVEAGFSIDGGPVVIERFFVTDDSNDVAVRVLALINKVPAGKRNRIIAACNHLNAKLRYFKFILTEEGNVDFLYDFPAGMGDDDIGLAAVEIFFRTMGVLNHHYDVLMEALYGREEMAEEDEDERAQRLLRFQEALRAAIREKDTADRQPDEAAEDETEDHADDFKEAEG